MDFHGQSNKTGGGSDDPIDKILYDKYFTGKTTGTAIECGANDGLYLSTCLTFETIGWKTINIEASINNFDRLIINRPNSINYLNALSNENDKEVTVFNYNDDNGGINRIEETPETHLTLNKPATKTTAKTIRYDSLIKEPVDLFVIDVEGAELKVIEGMITSCFLPSVLCIEHAHVGIDSIKEKLAPLYKLDFIDNLNAIFIKEKIKISAIMPTKNRPSNLERIFDSAIDTVSDMKNFEFSIRIDDDDTVSMPIIEKYKDRINIRVDSRPKDVNMANIWNGAWKNATGEIFMMCGDDFVFRTKNWDNEIRAEFENSSDKIIMVFGEDGLQHDRLSTHSFLHKRWTDTLGYFAPPQFNAYYHDTWIDDIAKIIGRRIYKSNLFFEHMHPAANKAKDDDTYKYMSARANNEGNLYQSLSGLRNQEADKLREAMKSPEPITHPSHVNVPIQPIQIYHRPQYQEPCVIHNPHPERTPML